MGALVTTAGRARGSPARAQPAPLVELLLMQPPEAKHVDSNVEFLVDDVRDPGSMMDQYAPAFVATR